VIGSISGATVDDNSNVPGIIQIFDWASPAAKIMGIKFNEGSALADRVERYDYLRNYGGFKCPENEIISTVFSPTLAAGMPGTGYMVSYNTAMGFLLTRNNTGANATSGPTAPVGRTIGRTGALGQGAQNPPSNYGVRLSQVGDASRKIYIGDGARFSTISQAPDADVTAWGGNGGAYSDQGAPFKFSRSWDRSFAPGNGGSTGVDARIYAFRHGTNRRGGKADDYKANFAYFDGHVELLGDLEASNPMLWFPKGTECEISASQIWTDAFQKYYNGTQGIVTLP
jgi:prepilin-type processing-associated H-X9-DG protein